MAGGRRFCCKRLAAHAIAGGILTVSPYAGAADAGAGRDYILQAQRHLWRQGPLVAPPVVTLPAPLPARAPEADAGPAAGPPPGEAAPSAGAQPPVPLARPPLFRTPLIPPDAVPVSPPVTAPVSTPAPSPAPASLEAPAAAPASAGHADPEPVTPAAVPAVPPAAVAADPATSLAPIVATPRELPWQASADGGPLGRQRGLAPTHMVEYVIQAQRFIQHQSNPYRLPDNQAADRVRDTVVADEVRAALNVPLLSAQTRLTLAAALGNVSYDRTTALDHQPHQLEAGLRWRAGRLLEGAVSLYDRKQLNRFLTRSFPERDMVSQRGARVEAGLKVSESLTLPIVAVSSAAARYEYAQNAVLFNRDDERLEVSGRYTGIDDAVVSLGVARTVSRFTDRTPLLLTQLGRRYRDDEIFVDGRWRHSVKTAIDGHLSYRDRRYDDVDARNVSLVTAAAKLQWDYSAKTQFLAHLWYQPYANEDDPALLYSTLLGARLSMRWRPSEKLWLSFNAVREKQSNVAMPGGQDSHLWSWRFGPRLEWDVQRNVKIVLDGWRDKVVGYDTSGSDSFVARVGLVLNYDNGAWGTARQFRLAECAPPRYVDAQGCD